MIYYVQFKECYGGDLHFKFSRPTRPDGGHMIPGRILDMAHVLLCVDTKMVLKSEKREFAYPAIDIADIPISEMDEMETALGCYLVLGMDRNKKENTMTDAIFEQIRESVSYDAPELLMDGNGHFRYCNNNPVSSYEVLAAYEKMRRILIGVRAHMHPPRKAPAKEA